VDLHVPEGPIRSLKDFLLHIVIVTIGILIALGLEQAVEAHHRAKLARDAIEGFRRELTSDMSDMDAVLEENPRVQSEIADWIANLSSANPHPMEKYPGVHFNILPTASWDTAMATQALSELSYEQAHLYATAYELLRVFIAAERDGLANWQNLRSFGLDPAAMTPDQRRQLIERLRRYQADLVVLESAGKNTKEACRAAVEDQSHA